MKEHSSRLVRAFTHVFLTYPDRPAIETNNGVLTYEALNKLSSDLADCLTKATSIGEFIGIEAHKNASTIVAMVACVRANRPFVMIDPRDSLESNQKKIELLRVNCLARKGPQFGENILIDTEQYVSYSSNSKRERREDLSPFYDSMVYAIYTSGSTGEPKCVLVEQDPLAAVVQDHVEKLDLSSSSKTLQFARLTFDGCMTEIFWSLTSGACLVVLDESYLMPGDTLQNTLEEFAITHLKTTPFALTVTKPTPKMNIQHVINGGGACRPAMRQAWSRYAAFHNAYGTTETTVCNLLTPALTDEDCINGIPLGECVGQVDFELAPVANSDFSSMSGELVFTGASVAIGYLNEDQLTRFTDNNEPKYFTGDLVNRIGNQLYFVERLDRQLKVRGYRIDPGEVEGAVCGSYDVSEAVVLASNDEFNETLVCYYVGEREQRTLRKELEEKLDSYKIPSVFHQVAKLPYTKNGKVDRDELLRMHKQSVNDAKNDESEHPLISLVSALTGVQGVSEQDSFLELGGDSASTLILIKHLKEQGWSDVGVKDIFQAPDLKALIARFEVEKEDLACVE
ncbi:MULTISPECIES: non-ribosomal peptide synthetase [unclassified Pseudoalteromonas]|uniref:non-ribosomal peptide synthetase n=1 Tax=unclassified Pseudoalteromonas TaxID=194690 RepID=UPI0020975C5B|nr:non-ribosomal peptide synthetase [Pseudoalteromonas sp. XMcav2-N]MCO7188407.1 non-ribosomal peptide synthetase [Pseudoalteromonas sp. XMcav2-N]